MPPENGSRALTGVLVLGVAVEDGGRSGHAELTINSLPQAKHWAPRTGGCKGKEEIK